ncbi:RecX family transcriptional regulator [Patescibacteria group bacterium]|nr:RecX family transcriptional regulator [Patescibacteria group bacterium]
MPNTKTEYSSTRDELYEKLYSRILHFISHKPRSEKEVEDKLSTLTSEEGIKEEIIADLRDKNYIGDVSYAEEYVRGVVSSRKACSKRKMKQFLFRKGVHRDVVTVAFNLFPPEFEYDNALKEGKKKIKMILGADEFTRKAKISDCLYRKGYPSSVVTRVIDTLS